MTQEVGKPVSMEANTRGAGGKTGIADSAPSRQQRVKATWDLPLIPTERTRSLEKCNAEQ